MNTKQILAIVALLAVSVSSASAYDEIECSTDAVFSANSCAQCFDWGQQSVGGNVGLLDDLWKNLGETAKIMYKDNQTLPTMVSLGGSNWSQSPSSDGFWEWTDELEALYSEDDQGYILEAWAEVKFIQSKGGYAYVLDSTEANQWENAGLLVFPLITHRMWADGDISEALPVHNECVLYKAWDAATPVVDVEIQPEPQEMAQVETGAEAYLILLFALILGFVYIKTRKEA